jgi:glutaredoxin
MNNNDNEKEKSTVIMYTSKHCIWCGRVKRLLTDNDYPISEEIIVGSDDNPTAIPDFKSKYNQDLKTVPQVIIDGKLIGGYTEVERLVKGLKSINRV